MVRNKEEPGVQRTRSTGTRGHSTACLSLPLSRESVLFDSSGGAPAVLLRTSSRIAHSDQTDAPPPQFDRSRDDLKSMHAFFRGRVVAARGFFE